MNDAVWAVREDLASVYRLLGRFGWDDAIHTHASASLPGEAEHILINRYGDLFTEVQPDLLVAIDHSGALVDGYQGPMNTAGIVIHTAIHAARPDVRCVIHTHTQSGVAVSCQAEGLLPLNQTALLFYDDIAYHDFEGIALDREEQVRLAADLGDRSAMILRNHGLLVVGRTVAEAFSRIYHLERACAMQIAALSGNRTLRLPDQAVCRRTKAQYEADDDGALELEWAAFKRLANRPT
jgi:ribulose-5-phosphate 4-epimerase/fuculose-1-phosphate aldolase